MKKLAVLISIVSIILIGCASLSESSSSHSNGEVVLAPDNKKNIPEEVSQVIPSKVMSYEVSTLLNNKPVNLFSLVPGTYDCQDLEVKINGENVFQGLDKILVELIEPTAITMKDADIYLAGNSMKILNHRIAENEYSTDLLSGEITVIDKDRRFLNNSIYATIHINAYVGSIIINYPELGEYPIFERKLSTDPEEMISIFASTFISEPMSVYINHRIVLDRHSSNKVILDYIKKHSKNSNVMEDREFRIINLLNNVTITKDNKDDFIKLLKENAVNSPHEVDIANIILMPMDNVLDLTEFSGEKMKISIRVEPTHLSAFRLTAGNRKISVLPAFNYMKPISDANIPKFFFSLSAMKAKDGVLIRTVKKE